MSGGLSAETVEALKKVKASPLMFPNMIAGELGGIVLDPFSGSGSTIVAARREGFRAIGIEQSQAFAETARARISRWEDVREDLDDREAITVSNGAKVDEAQRGLFG